MRAALGLPIVPLLAVAVALGAIGDGQVKPEAPAPAPTPARKAATPASVDSEAEVMAFLGEHHPELARVLGPLRARNPAEYRKAIGELAQVARNLAEVRARNPKRYEVALEAWKARSRVELAAAQLAGAPSEELRSQLRTAIEAKVDAEVRRQRFELEQAEAHARRLRESLDRLENHRDAVVEARFRALQPKKAGARPGDKAGAAPATAPAASHRENRP